MMNKSAIQKYAVWARNELIEQVKQRAFQYGINENSFGEENASIVSGYVLSNDEKRQRRSFIEVIKRSSYQQVVEEVAYTWFNRFIALRYMEVNDFLPSHVRVFSNSRGNFNPEILTSVLHIDLLGLDKAKVSEYLNNNQTQELYRYLLLTQCNALNELLPEMFKRLGAYTEMLLPNNILKSEGVIGRLVSDIPEEDFKDAVQIIGWFYQYYNTEPKQEVFDGLKKNIKITKDKIPAATQLFTPDWIVRYMVENSLGRLWLESHPNSKLREGWKYYLDEAEQIPEVTERLRVLRLKNSIKSPEEIKFIDPCMGSGHILVYAFDVLVQIYTSEGYSERDAAQLILEKNLFGLDIDRRAYQLSYFSLMMKARQYNRRILSLGIKPQVYEPTGYPDGLEYGSLIKIQELEPKPEKQRDSQTNLFEDDYETKLNIWHFRRLLSKKYDVVVTNPPYMGINGASTNLTEFLKKTYVDSKSDLSTAFMEKTLELCDTFGYMAMINIPVWMFLTSYELLRTKLIANNTLINMLHFGRGIFGSDFGSTGFVFCKAYTQDYQAKFRRLFEKQGSVDNIESKRGRFLSGSGEYVASANNFKKIPGSPIAYWVSEQFLQTFLFGRKISEVADSRMGLTTGDNDRFLRFWFEVYYNNIEFNAKNSSDAIKSECKWFPYHKGGEYRKWYGNNDYIINWLENGKEVSDFPGSTIRNRDYYFKEGITWSLITSSIISFRYRSKGFVFGDAGPAVFAKTIDQNVLLGLLNSNIMQNVSSIINPTINSSSGVIANFPVILDDKNTENIKKLVSQNIIISTLDWDSFETSWDFAKHPLIGDKRTIKEEFTRWKFETQERLNNLKNNEQELNDIFINIYRLHDELTSEVENQNVTVRLADLGRDIRSLISYAVGCIFGRYSLDAEGLVFAGGEWNVDKYKIFTVDKDNILPILDDEYFEDDIVGRFITFIKTVYGHVTLEENLKFIADALGGKDTSREVIRNYFLNDFYVDHLRIFKKRPIYWMFDSGKKNGFKALIYMHRYSRDLLAKLRTDYVHEQQERYRTQLSRISSELNRASGVERSKLLKQQDKLSDQLREIIVFEEKVHHLADQHIEMNIDDGVEKNYTIFADILTKI